MEKEIFDLLIDISNKGLIHIESPTTRNRDQAILEGEKYRQLKYLLSEGLISSSGNETYIITEFGYEVSKHGNWINYLKFQKDIRDRKIKKESIDLKISEFQIRTKFLPYYVSAISILISLVALTDPFKWGHDGNKYRKTELPKQNIQLDTISHTNKDRLDTATQYNHTLLK